MTVYLQDVAQAIADTVKTADPDRFSTFFYLEPAPPLPAVVVNVEHDPLHRDTMDSEEFQWWRVWVLVESPIGSDAAIDLLAYIDTVGERSIPAAFQAENAPWRLVTGLSEVYFYGFARLPSDIQGPQWVSFGGTEMWGTALLIRVMYGNEDVP